MLISMHIARAVALPILVGVMACLTGSCASSRLSDVTYDRSRDRSTYQSARARMGSPGMSGGLASDQRVTWQAIARCAGENCIPPYVEIIFLNEGTGELNLDSRRVQLNYDGIERSWEDLSRTIEPPHYSVPRGEFSRISLDTAEFARMAGAGRVEVIFGLTGTTGIIVPYERREAFRSLAELLGYGAGG